MSNNNTRLIIEGFSPIRLARISPWIDSLIKEEKLPYASTIIARGNRIVLTTGDTSKRVRVFALSGPLVCVALMTFWEDGMFALDDPITKHLKEFGHPTILRDASVTPILTSKSKSAMTIRHLLTHTAGLSHGYDTHGTLVALDALYEANGLNDPTLKLDRFIQKLGRMPLLYEPGSEWHYSVAVDVLARLCEVLSGQSIDDVLQTRVFTPLGMLDSFVLRPSNTANANIADLYMPASSRASMMYPRHRNSKHLRGLVTVTSPVLRESTPVISTANDYYRFIDCLMNDGLSSFTNIRILSPRTCQLMTSNQLETDLYSMARVKFSETPLHGTGFCLGLGAVHVNEFDACSPGTVSWGGSGGSFFFLDRKLQISGVFFTQCLFIDVRDLNLRSGFMQRVYSSLEHVHGGGMGMSSSRM